MAKAGRKSWTEELKLAQRYSDLSEDYFKILKDLSQSEDKADQKFFIQEMSKAYVKMIPQSLDLDGTIEHTVDDETRAIINKALQDI